MHSTQVRVPGANRRVVAASVIGFLQLRLQQRPPLIPIIRPPIEHHQPPCHLHRHVPARVGLDQRQGQIDTGTDSGRGPDRSLLNINRVAVEGDLRKHSLEQVRHRPMGGNP